MLWVVIQYRISTLPILVPFVRQFARYQRLMWGFDGSVMSDGLFASTNIVVHRGHDPSLVASTIV